MGRSKLHEENNSKEDNSEQLTEVLIKYKFPLNFTTDSGESILHHLAIYANDSKSTRLTKVILKFKRSIAIEAGHVQSILH